MPGMVHTFWSIRPHNWFSPIFDGFPESENIYIVVFNKNDIYAKLRRTFHGLQGGNKERELKDAEIFR